MRSSDRALIFLALAAGGFALTFADAARLRAAGVSTTAEMRQLVERLGLTDPVLFTEARYTRHPSQADLQSAFQDHPTALEHFPTGSIAGPPAGLRRLNDKLD